MDLEVKVRFSQMGWEAPGCRWFTGLRVHTVLAQCPVLSVPRCLNGLTGNTQRQVRKSRVSSRGWIRYTVLTGGLPGATAALPTAFSAVPLKAGLFEITPKRGVRLDRGLDVESPPPTAETYARYNTTPQKHSSQHIPCTTPCGILRFTFACYTRRHLLRPRLGQSCVVMGADHYDWWWPVFIYA